MDKDAVAELDRIMTSYLIAMTTACGHSVSLSSCRSAPATLGNSYRMPSSHELRPAVRTLFAPRPRLGTAEKHWCLSAVPILSMLTSEELAQLERKARLRSFQRKEVIFFPSEPGESVLIVLQGRVKIKDITRDGKESILTFVEEGELFGELALFDDDTRQNFAEAVLATEIAMIAKKDFLAVMEQRTDLTLTITRLVGLRRKQAEARLRQLLFRSTRERIIYLLLDLIPQHGKASAKGIELTLPLSHQDMASLVGATRESVTMTLGELQGEGLVRVRRQRLTITNFDVLHSQVHERP